MNNSTLSPDWLTVNCHGNARAMVLLTVGTVDFDWFVTSCFSELLALISVQCS